ncbi:signal recognition particle-docking protein FtsY [Candidatus Poriferisodalis sp.]|uniref:signal recognition particle-docking protein FtsY n=1 Tax=Candidatus Poriferisodalis sp. TaxID=3101277 RepID=UPI003B026F02
MSSTATLILVMVAVTVLLGALPFIQRAVQRRRRPTSPAPTGGRASSPHDADCSGTAPPHADEPAVDRVASAEAKPLPREAMFASGLAAARRRLRDRLASIQRRQADSTTWELLEEALLGADVGVATTMATLDRLRQTAAETDIVDADQLTQALADQMRRTLVADRSLRLDSPTPERVMPVWLFVGVNGVGKTTTIGKVGARLAAQGRRVVMAAGDTFRAAAASQLQKWADRCGAEVISGSDGADPSSVVHDAVSAAAARNADVVLADTAGRLQNRKNLMDELAKVRRVADRAPGAVVETLLVIDATTGQNGLSQARAFAEATDVTGVALTKLDGSAKGGIVFAIEAELGLPVKLVGLGEGADDLVDFDPDRYIEALLGTGAQDSCTPQDVATKDGTAHDGITRAGREALMVQD